MKLKCYHFILGFVISWRLFAWTLSNLCGERANLVLKTAIHSCLKALILLCIPLKFLTILRLDFCNGRRKMAIQWSTHWCNTSVLRIVYYATIVFFKAMAVTPCSAWMWFNMKSDGVIMVILLLLYCNDAWRDCVSIRERHVSSHVGQGWRSWQPWWNDMMKFLCCYSMDLMDGAIVLCGSEPLYWWLQWFEPIHASRKRWWWYA